MEQDIGYIQKLREIVMLTFGEMEELAKGQEWLGCPRSGYIYLWIRQ